VVRFKIVLACLAVGIPLLAGSASAEGAGIRTGIDVLEPVEGAPWSGDRMHGARERLKDILPGKRR
jgi:hypothetical protein